jgi:hypothetical protein
MKRTWIWGLCATVVTGGAIALAQQEGPSTTPAGSPPIATTAGQASASGALAPSSGPITTTQTLPVQSSGGGFNPYAAPSPRPITSTNSDPFAGVQARSQNSGIAGTSGDWDDPNAAQSKSAAKSRAPKAGGQASAFGTFSDPSVAMQHYGQHFSGMARGRGPGPSFPSMMQSKEGQAYRAAEQKTMQLASRLRSLGPDHPESAKTEEELRAAVTEAFEARQAMQKTEVEKLKKKLAEIEAHVARREEAKKLLIDERVYNLKENEPDSPSIFSQNFNFTAPRENLPFTQPGPNEAVQPGARFDPGAPGPGTPGAGLSGVPVGPFFGPPVPSAPGSTPPPVAPSGAPVADPAGPPTPPAGLPPPSVPLGAPSFPPPPGSEAPGVGR